MAFARYSTSPIRPIRVGLARGTKARSRVVVWRQVQWLLGRSGSPVVAIGVLLGFWLVLVGHG